MINDMDKLVSDIICELDYDMWKEMYHFDENDSHISYLKDNVKSLIESWYNTTVEKEYG